MGPGDPFGKPGRAQAQANEPEVPFTSTRNASSEPDRMDELLKAITQARRSQPALIGMVLGAVVGVLLLFNAVVEGLFVILCAAVGGVVAYIGHGLLTGRFDLGAAWRALRGGS